MKLKFASEQTHIESQKQPSKQKYNQLFFFQGDHFIQTCI